MQYMLLIYVDPASYAGIDRGTDAGRNGAILCPGSRRCASAAPMWPVTACRASTLPPPFASATAKRLLTDGPFAETKEHLGGFYIVEANDLDEAIEWAAKIPDVVRGSIEVRPIAVYNQ